MRLLLCFISVVICSKLVLAETSPSSAQIVNSGIQLLLVEVTKKEKSSAVNSNQIAGTCYFDQGKCPGAKITLLDSEKNNLVQVYTIAMDGKFSFSGLKNSKYKLVVDYPRYGASGSLENIEPGSWLFLTLKRIEKK